MTSVIKKSLLLLLLFIVVGCSNNTASDDQASTVEENGEASEAEQGGVLNIGLDAQPPTLDPPMSSAIASRDTSKLIFETLLTTDENFQAVPMLADSVRTEDNQTFNFKLRQGVKFHNGEEMMAEDVIASMERWQETSPLTGSIFDDATWEAEDDYTVILTLSNPSALTLDTIATVKHAPAIMPKEIVESADAEGVTEYVGTGPYKLVEWKQDQHIHLERFDDYVPDDGEPSGLSGEKVAHFDEIYFHIVPDTSTRLAGLQSGEYDFSFGIPYDNYDQLESDDSIKTYLDVNGVEVLKYNLVEGPSTDYQLREAINVGLDMEALMTAAFPNEDLYWLHSGYMDEDLANWKSDAGSEFHNINDLEKAKELLEGSNYDGEEFTIMTTRDYEHLYNVAVVVQDQLKNLGINAELEVYDWPTMFNNFDDPDTWDAFVMSFSVVSTPPQFLGLSPAWASGFDDDHAEKLMSEIETAATIEDAKEQWDELQQYAWEEFLPVTSFGSFHSLYGSTDKLEGVTTYSGPVFWNAHFIK